MRCGAAVALINDTIATGVDASAGTDIPSTSITCRTIDSSIRNSIALVGCISISIVTASITPITNSTISSLNNATRIQNPVISVDNAA